MRWFPTFIVLMGSMVLAGAAWSQPVEAPAPPAPVPPPSTGPTTPDPLAQAQQLATLHTLAGRWHAWIGDQRVLLVLNEDRTFQLDQRDGFFRVQENRLSLESPRGDLVYDYKIEPTGTLTLSAPGVAPVSFMRQTGLRAFISRIIDVSWPDALRTLYRIGLILMLAVICRLVVWLVRVITSWMLFSKGGATRFLGNRHRNRAMTIHALVLNVVKYVVYFTALGFVLNEIGINTTTYLASLSVIGLAIGFGSQGLVQDMVTGFFIIFESQFDVGDMVEIGGQIGVVEDLGLRMTKLRNFVGQVVVIPNRNISVVANYSRGALMATLEVAIANREQINEAGAVLLNVAAEVQRQFHGVVLRDPQLLEPMMLKTGEQFAQLNLGIWPGQQWLIDGQLAPRIREALAREKVAMPAPPADRIAVHYFPPREAAVSDWHQAIQMLQRLREQPRLERFREFMD